MDEKRSRGNRRQRRSPVKARPLRSPGQSLERQLDELATQKVWFWVMLPVMLLLFAFSEWLFGLLDQPRRPWLFAGCAAVLATVGAARLVRLMRRTESLRLGLAGERAVGQFLDDEVRQRGFRVFHDLVEADADGRRFNIDHVLVGPGGIFAIETKTRSKPAVGLPTVRYKGEAVSVDGGPFDEAPLRQARASAQRVREIIEQSTGRSGVLVRPVVLFPGWYIEGSSSGREAWVLEPKALPKWLDAEGQRLSSEDVALYASRLAGHVRRP